MKNYIVLFIGALMATLACSHQTLAQDSGEMPCTIVYSWRPLVSNPANLMIQDDDADEKDEAGDDDDDDDKKDKITPQMTVRGEAELDKPADQLRMSIGVVTENADATKALEDNSEAMQGVVDALKTAGLKDGEYQTGNFRITPQFSRRPARADENWRPEIVSYQVMNTVDVKTKKLELAGDLIQAANKAGANTVSGVSFDMADARTHRAEAIREATKNARDDARILADAAGVKLVRVLSVRLDDAQPISEYRSQMRMAGDAAMSAPPPSITPGDVTIRASVTIVYEIKGGGDEAAALRSDAGEDDHLGFDADIPF